MISGLPQLVANPFEETSIAQHQLGSMGVDENGRWFRYAKMGEAITRGYVTQAPAIDTATITMAVTSAAAIGDKKIVFTHGATTSAASEYADGYAIISYGTGIGQTLRIKDHAAYTSGQTSCELFLKDGIQVALDTTSKLDIEHNPWRGVLMDTSLVTVPTGVALRSFTSGYYGWLLTRGVAGVFADATVAAGYAFAFDASVSGAIDVPSNDLQQFGLGNAIQASAQNYAHPVYVKID